MACGLRAEAEWAKFLVNLVEEPTEASEITTIGKLHLYCLKWEH
jgi:hypothetical protein